MDTVSDLLLLGVMMYCAGVQDLFETCCVVKEP